MINKIKSRVKLRVKFENGLLEMRILFELGCGEEKSSTYLPHWYTNHLEALIHTIYIQIF